MKIVIFLLVVMAIIFGGYLYFGLKNSENVMVLNENNFVEKTKEGVSVVDFYADWCGPCRLLTPIMEEVGRELNGVGVGVFKVNVDESPKLASEFRVSSVPLVVFLKDGKEASRLVGLRNKREYLDEVSKIK